MPDPIIVDVQGIGPVEFPAGTSGAQIEAWVMAQLRQAGVPSQTWGQWLGNQAARVGGGIAGGLVGSLAGPVGTFAGTATGAAMGDEWAQSREVAQGVRDAVNPLEMVAAGVTAPIPGATIGKGPLLRQVPKALAAAVPGAAASSVGLQLAETGTVDPWRTAMETGRGAGLSTLIGVGIPASLRAGTRIARNEVGAVGDLDAAKALYLQRGGGQSPSRMMQALRDTGLVSGELKTAAEKQAANALVARLVAEAEGLPPPVARPAAKPTPQRPATVTPVQADVDPVRSTADQRALDEMFARLDAGDAAKVVPFNRDKFTTRETRAEKPKPTPLPPWTLPEILAGMTDSERLLTATRNQGAAFTPGDVVVGQAGTGVVQRIERSSYQDTPDTVRVVQADGRAFTVPITALRRADDVTTLEVRRAKAERLKAERGKK